MLRQPCSTQVLQDGASYGIQSAPLNPIQKHYHRSAMPPLAAVHNNNNPLQLSRRQQLALGLSPLLWQQEPLDVLQPTNNTPTASAATTNDDAIAELFRIPNYASNGPCQAIRLPQLEHYCTTCKAAADRCRVRVQAYYPKGGIRAGLNGPPFPLIVISSGFLIGSDQYASYAERLATWGYVVVTYDVNQQALDPITDTVSVDLLTDLIDWIRISEPLGSISDTNKVLLVGHSRGCKISTLTACVDPRVRSVFLIDPVDVTVYAPLAPEFPSATEKLKNSSETPPYPLREQPLPVAIIGSGLGSDCVPIDSNYSLYFDSAPGAAFEAVFNNAGHLQFLDARAGSILDAVCIAGPINDASVQEVTKALLVAWSEATLRGPFLSTSSSGKKESAAKDAEEDELQQLQASLFRNQGKRFGIGSDGKVVAGPFPAMDTLTRLYAAVKDGKQRVKALSNGGNGGSGAIELEIQTRAKNFVF